MENGRISISHKNIAQVSCDGEGSLMFYVLFLFFSAGHAAGEVKEPRMKKMGYQYVIATRGIGWDGLQQLDTLFKSRG